MKKIELIIGVKEVYPYEKYISSSEAKLEKNNKVSLKGFINSIIGKGKWTIIVAWHSKCGVCMSKMSEMVQSIGTYDNTEVFGISLDGSSNIAKMIIEKYKINFLTFLSDVKEFSSYVKEVAKKKVEGIPVFMIFSPKGKLVAYQSGYISPQQLKEFIKNNAY